MIYVVKWCILLKDVSLRKMIRSNKQRLNKRRVLGVGSKNVDWLDKLSLLKEKKDFPPFFKGKIFDNCQ